MTNFVPFQNESTFVHQVILPSIAGEQTYLIPVGCIFTNRPGEFLLEVDKGTGFVRETEGIDYAVFTRNGAPLSVADIGFGFFRPVAPPAGWNFRLTWYERIVHKTPMGIAKIKLTGVGGTVDMSVRWNQNSANAPNGVTVPELTGYVVEFWRKVQRSGGLHGLNLNDRQRRGPRYIPRYRGTAGKFNFHVSEFTGGTSFARHKFRVCYYNPLTFARSMLSTDIIVACSPAKADKVGLPALNTVPPRAADAQVRQAGSVWIE